MENYQEIEDIDEFNLSGEKSNKALVKEKPLFSYSKKNENEEYAY